MNPDQQPYEDDHALVGLARFTEDDPEWLAELDEWRTAARRRIGAQS